jgi:hypothetical protein
MGRWEGRSRSPRPQRFSRGTLKMHLRALFLSVMVMAVAGAAAAAPPLSCALCLGSSLLLSLPICRVLVLPVPRAGSSLVALLPFSGCVAELGAIPAYGICHSRCS